MDWFRRFMMGRHGVDQLSTAMMVLSFILLLAGQMLNVQILVFLALAILVLSYIRTLSRNTSARYRENYLFLKWWNPIQRWFRTRFKQVADIRKYKYFKCVKCKQILRVPRGKGKVKITCPKCRTEMIKRA